MIHSWMTTSTNPNLSDVYQKEDVTLNIIEPKLNSIDSFIKGINSNYTLDPKFFKVHDNLVFIKIFDSLIKTSIEVQKYKSGFIYSDFLLVEKVGKDYVVSRYQTQKDIVTIFSLNYANNVRSNGVLINNFPLYTGLNNYIGIVYMPNKSLLVIDKACYMNLNGKILKQNIDNYNDLIEIITKYNLNYNGIFNRYVVS
ncbi:MAG: hypothetical protein QXS19_08305 [Candidatus Methanomethylicia archaeon]